MRAPDISPVQTLVWLPTQPDPLPAWRKAGREWIRALPSLPAQGKCPALAAVTATWANSPGCSRAAHQVPADPVHRHQSKAFLYLRDHFAADMDCSQVINVIIINKIPDLPFVNNEEAAKNCLMHTRASAFGLTKAFKLHRSSTDTSKQENSY